MISGFVGWTNVSNGVVTPISLLGINGNMISVPGGKGIRIRKTPSLKGTVITQVSTTTNFSYTETKSADGYTWYKISYNGSDAWIAKTDSVSVLTGTNGLGTYYERNTGTNNLIHHFTYYNGSGYGDTFTNLGTAPTYLTPGVRYYSFDGNYFYANITTMLDDYRSGKYISSVNANSPHYAYYLYLSSHSVTGYTAEDFDNIIANKGYTASTSKMYGTGKYFKEAEATYGQNALMMFGTAMNESATGTSRIAMDKNNLFGYGAADSCAYDCAYSYNSVRDSIMDYAQKTGNNYSLATGKYYYGSHYGNKSSGRNVKYATDPYWGEKQAGNSFTNDKNYGGKDFNSSTIGAVKKGVSSPWVFSEPAQTSAGHIYTLKNPNSDAIVNDISVNVVDKVMGTNGVEFYKIYTDLPASDNKVYGYVTAAEINVANNQPVINASDKTISEGSDFDPLEGVTASDAEDGPIKDIEYDSEVKTDTVGDYKVTYTVKDSHGQVTTKTITVKVIVNQLPVINASDKTIYLNSDFDPLEGVTASDKEDGPISKIDVDLNEVKPDQLGKYKVTYSVTDSYGQTVKKTITVTVSEKVLEKKDGWFHIEEISFNNNQLKISGFEIITGISNSKNDDINYELIVKNQDIEEEVTYDLNRWLDDVPFVPNDGSSNDYSGSWFTGNIDLSKLGDGDYTMYIKASGEDYYSQDVVSNAEYNDNIERKYEGTDGTGYMIRENKTLSTVDLELFVRSDGLVTYGNTPVWSGLYSDLFSYDLDGDTLNLVGTSYALKTDYKSSDNVEREIVFENKDTHKIVYRQDIGSITDGPYKVTSNTNNDLTRAWFDSGVDISSLDKGTYIIYIRTKVGSVEDYSELADSAYSDLSQTTEFDGKKVALKRNNDQRIRLELVIE